MFSEKFSGAHTPEKQTSQAVIRTCQCVCMCVCVCVCVCVCMGLTPGSHLLLRKQWCVAFSDLPSLPEEDKAALVEEEVGTVGLPPLIGNSWIASLDRKQLDCLP